MLYNTKYNSKALGFLLLTMILASAELLVLADGANSDRCSTWGTDVADLWIADGEAQEAIGPRVRL